MRIRKSALITAAVVSAIGNLLTSHASQAANVYWDINGTTDGSGAVAGAASGTWTSTTTNWNTDSAGGVGTLTADVGIANVGVFAAGTDATGSYTVTLLKGTTQQVGGLQVEEGTIINFSGTGTNGAATGTALLNLPAAGATFDVATNSTLNLGNQAAGSNIMALTSTATSAAPAVLTKTGNGFLFLNGTTDANGLNSKWIVNGGTVGVFVGNSANELGITPAAFTSDWMTLNGGGIQCYETSGLTLGTTRGITIGANGGSVDIHGNSSVSAAIGTLTTNGRITGTGTITVKGAGIWVVSADNSLTTTAPAFTGKWVLTGAELNPNISGADTGLGKDPTTYLADSVTFNTNGSLRVSANMTIPATRGITLGAGICRLHPINGTTVLTVNSIITGTGNLTVGLANDGTCRQATLSAANSYSGSTIVEAGTLNLTGSLATTAVNLFPAGIATFAGALTATPDVTNAGAITFTTASQAIGALNGTATGSGSISLSGPTALTVASGSYAGAINGGGSLTKNTGGTLVLSGSNPYGGTTSVTNGTLLEMTNASLPNYLTPNQFSVSTGATFAVNASGAGGQWLTGEITFVLGNDTFASGSNIGINVDAAAPTFNHTSDLNVVTANIGLVKLGGGTLELSAAQTYTGPTNVSAGKLLLDLPLTKSSSFTVQSGATAELAAGAGNNVVLSTPALSVLGTGQLNVQDNKVITASSIGVTPSTPYTGITQLIQSGRNGGTWNGPGIITAQTNALGAGALTTVAVDTGADVKTISGGTTALWGGQVVHATDTLVMYTYAGDANLDGQITGDDYAKIDSGFAAHATFPGYAAGDFNYDGVVNADDYFLIDANYGRQGSPIPQAPGLAGVSAVPEPASLALIAFSAVALLPRRRRR